MADQQHKINRFLAVLVLSIVYVNATRGAAPDATVLRIQDEIKSGRIDEAEIDVNAALKLNAQDGGLYNLRGIIYANQRQVEAAKDDFAQAIRFSPRLIGAYLNFGKACELRATERPADLEEAIEQFQKLLTLEPTAQSVRIQLAKLLEERASYSASLRELNRLAGSDAGTGLATLIRCADLVGLRREKEAETVAKSVAKATDLDEDSLEAVMPTLRKNDSVLITVLGALNLRQSLSPSTLQYLALAYARTGKWGDARLIGEKMAAANPNDPVPLLDLAHIAQEQADFEGALGYLAHARDLDPNSAPIHFFFGIVCIELNLPVEAKKSLEKALSLDPDNAEYNYARGSVELQGRSAWQAIPYFRKFAAARPQDQRGHFALGAAEFASEDYDASKQEMKLAASSPKTAAGAEYFLGRISKVDNDWKSAAEHFEKSIKTDSNYAESHAEFGLAQMHLGDLVAARKELDRALALRPDSYLANSDLLVFLRYTKNPQADSQDAKLRKLDADRWQRQELLVRTIRVDPYSK